MNYYFRLLYSVIFIVLTVPGTKEQIQSQNYTSHPGTSSITRKPKVQINQTRSSRRPSHQTWKLEVKTKPISSTSSHYHISRQVKLGQSNEANPESLGGFSVCPIPTSFLI